MKLFTNIIKCKHSCVILSIFYIIFLEKLIFFIAFILLRKCYFKYNIYIPSRWQAGGRTSLVASDSRGQHLYPALCTSIPNYFSGIQYTYIIHFGHSERKICRSVSNSESGYAERNKVLIAVIVCSDVDPDLLYPAPGQQNYHWISTHRFKVKKKTSSLNLNLEISSHQEKKH